MNTSNHYLLWVILLLSLGIITDSHSQSIHLEDHFEDGDFTSDPAWSGDDSLYIIISDAENHRLRLDGNDGSNPAYLSVPSTSVSGSWTFYLQLDFSPSDNNRADLFLMSDIADLSGPVNGYVLRAGENGSEDVFRVVRYDEGAETETILSGTTNISSGGSFRVKVTRQAGGVWSLEVGEGHDGSLTQEGETATDNTYSSASFFGIRSTYTSTRSDKFFFDDFTIAEFPVAIAQLNIESNQQFEVLFTKDIDPASVEASDFSINNGIGNPDTVSIRDNIAALSFTNPLPGGEYVLSISNVEDQSGNAIAPSSAISFSLFDFFESGDLIINEFMYDPPTGQPEYVEVKNISDKFFNLQDWQIGDNTNTEIISADTLILPPDEFLVLSSDTAVLSNIFGDQFYAENSMPALNNTGDAIKLMTNEGMTADSLSYTSGWGGNRAALERRSASTPGMYPENWGNSPDILHGTPGQTNKVPADKTAPALTELTILSNNILKLGFNERLEPATASAAANYSLSDSNLSSVTVTDPDSVELVLANPLQNAQSYTLELSGIGDVFDNVLSASDTLFTYYSISSADSGQVFITEFNYNPASGETEYIEIYNSSGRSFNLQNWTLNDNRGIEVPVASESFILPPESYAVLAPDNTLLKTDPDIRLVAMGNIFPALNNSGDDIVLKNKDQIVLDSLQYISAWGGHEWAMERKAMNLPAMFKENWGPAPEEAGSPGRRNGIPKDQTPPELLELHPLKASKLQLVFSEHITAASATAPANYKVRPARNLQHISVQSDTVTLFLASPMTSGETYTINVSGIADIFGNNSGSSSHKIEYLRFEEANSGDIVINEIMPVPDSEMAEFVELYNRSGKNIDLTDWSLGDAADEISIPPGTRLRSHRYLALTGSTVLAQKQPETIILTGFPNLNNRGDALFLKSEAGTTIDSLYYQKSWVDDAEGYSLERKDPFAASNDVSNWQPNPSNHGHTMGMQNAGFEEDTSPPRAIFATIRKDGQLEVHFNEFIQRTDNVQFFMDGVPLTVSSFDATQGHKIVLSAANPNSTVRTITIENLEDIRGNMMQSSNIPVVYPLQAGDLVINEIMFLPINDAGDKSPDQGEYIEFYNRRDYALSLEGVTLHDAPDENGEVRELQPVATTAKWVPPHETVLVYADPAPAFAQSRVAGFYNVDSTSMEAIIQVRQDNLGLASEDAIYIADSTGATIDSVYYSEAWHNPNLADSRGIALERITTGGTSNNRENWGSSVHPKGGTPKAENSLYQESPEQPQETGIRFAPNPFSPDGDGYEDNVVISYKLDQPDYLLRVNIFDRYGRHIKELTDGKPAGFEGSLTWDGRRNDGRRNRIGIYIIVFEAYDSASGSDKAFKKTVVLARKLN